MIKSLKALTVVASVIATIASAIPVSLNPTSDTATDDAATNYVLPTYAATTAEPELEWQTVTLQPTVFVIRPASKVTSTVASNMKDHPTNIAPKAPTCSLHRTIMSESLFCD